MTTKIDTAPEEILQSTIARCLKDGATDVDARLSKGRSVNVDVREGALESIERSESQALSLRCLVGQRQAHVSGSDLSAEGLAKLAERCVAMAKAAPEDPFCGLAPPEDLLNENRDLQLPGEDAITNEVLETDARAAEAAALEIDQVKHVSTSSAGWSEVERWVAASNGFSSFQSSGSTGLGLAVVAEADGKMERDYESRTTRLRSDRPCAEDIGRIAAQRAVDRLGSRKIETTTAPVIYDRRVAFSVIGAMLNAIAGPSVARGVSFLKDRLGEQIFSKRVDVVDDPFRPGGMGSRAHDGEGRPVRTRSIIDDGVLTEWMLNGASAKQLGLKPNGYASGGFGDPPGVGGSNIYLKPGDLSQEEMMAQAGKGLLVTDMFGPSINPNTGDYSVGVAGFWFEGGERVFPVSELTVAGDLPSMFARLVPASDLEFRGARDAPSIMIESMAIAGS